MRGFRVSAGRKIPPARYQRSFQEGFYGDLIPYVNAFDELKANLKAVEDAIERQEVSLVGVALDKRTKRNTMVERTLALSNSLFALAVDLGDLPMQERVRYSRTTLDRGRDAVVGQRCQAVHADGVGASAALAAYGVDAGALTALQTAIDAYVAVIGSPRTALTVRKGATAEMAMLVKDSMKILTERMDKLMTMFATTAPRFHQEYFDARIIVDNAARQTAPQEPDAPEAPGETAEAA